MRGFFAGMAILMVLGVLIGIACYVLYGMTHMRALKAMRYDKPWMAWVPGANYYALADCTKQSEFKMGNFTVPMHLFKLWWVIMFICSFVPVVGSLLMIALMGICQGWCYSIIFAVTEKKPVAEKQTEGYIAGFIPIVAIIKFFQLPKDAVE